MRLLQYLPRFRQAERQMEAMARRENWSRAEIESFQLDRLNAVWRHASEHTPYYRQLRLEQRLPAQFANLEEFIERMPMLEKAQLARDPHRFKSDRAQPGEWFRTSGSTGTPLSIYHSHEDHRTLLRARYRLYAMWGHDIFDRMVWLWNTHDTTAPGFVGQLKRTAQPAVDRLRNRLRLSAHCLAPHELRDHLRHIAAFRPSAIHGLSRAVGLLAQEAQGSGFRCDSLKFVSLTGETATRSLVAAVAAGFGAPAIVEYGSIEAPCIANEWPDRTLRVREDLVLLEAVPRMADVYELVLTVLANPAFPLLRYRIGDLTSRPLEVPAVGFSRLADVTGRKDDLIHTRDQRCLHPTCIDDLFESERLVRVRRYQVHQSRGGAIHATIEVNQLPSIEALGRLEHALRQLVAGFPVTVEIRDSIPQTAAGKHRLITSDFQDHHLPCPHVPEGMTR